MTDFGYQPYMESGPVFLMFEGLTESSCSHSLIVAQSENHMLFLVYITVSLLHHFFPPFPQILPTGRTTGNNKALFFSYPKGIQQKALGTENWAFIGSVAGQQSVFIKLSVTCCVSTCKANVSISMPWLPMETNSTEAENNKGLRLAHTVCPKQIGGRLCSPDPGSQVLPPHPGALFPSHPELWGLLQ